MIISNIKVAEIAYAINLSSASMVGAIAAIALPPHIPVPADIRDDNFQCILNNLPTRYPPPNAATRVNSITNSEYLPTYKT